MIRIARDPRPESGDLPGAPSGRAVRDPESMGRRLGEGARRTRLQGARHDQLRLRVHARAPRRERDARRDRRPRNDARPGDRLAALGRPRERLRARAGERRARRPAGRRGRSGRRLDRGLRPRRLPLRASAGRRARRSRRGSGPRSRLSVPAHRPGRKPPPRQPRPRRHDLAAPGLCSRPGRTCSTRPA